MGNLIPMEWNNQRIMTTKTLAECYGASEKNINDNFSNNKERFKEGKHYIKLEGKSLKEFKNSLPDEIGEPLKFVPKLMLWTERGALRHAKILDTDKAWDVYEQLEETYFKVRNMANAPSYMIEDPIKRAERWIEEQKEKQKVEAERDKLIHQGKLYTSSEIAKELGFKSARKLNLDLEEKRIQYKVNGTWVLYSEYSELGYTSVKQQVLDNGKIIFDRKWSGIGRDFILSLYNKKGDL